MAYYLSMDGVDDKISTPSMTTTEIVLDMTLKTRAAFKKYWSIQSTNDFFQINGSNVDNWSAGVSAVYLNGVAQTNSTSFVPLNTRATVRIVLTSAQTNINYIFNNLGTSGYLNGYLYDVKIYNGATLQAHYDMTLGNVNDQSGNGRNATLTGGTWVNDAAGTDANVTAIAATATNSALAPSVSGDASITSTSATSTMNGIAPSVSTQAVITSVAASATAQALAPSIGSPAIVTATVAIATAAGLGPAVVAIRNVEIMGSVATALAVAVVPRIHKAGWSSIAATSTTWRESTVAPTIWR